MTCCRTRKTASCSARSKKDPLGLPRPEITYDVGDYVRKSAQHTHDAYAHIAELLGGTEIQFDDKFAPNNHIVGSVIMGPRLPKNRWWTGNAAPMIMKICFWRPAAP